MGTTTEQLTSLVATVLVMALLAFALRERRPSEYFTFEPPSPSALDQLSQELGTIGQAAWYRQHDARGTTGDS
ncbi:MAG: hypothetical protein Q8M79_00400 [Dehalococcoidia bacterium]|nr:hypothetical protein [Dehalococcoidia bacterium]